MCACEAPKYGIELDGVLMSAPIGTLTPHSFCRQEAARSNGDSLVVNRQRAFQRGHALLRFLEFIYGVAGNRLQVGNVVLQRANLVASRLCELAAPLLPRG